jgi:hypothetical protein
MGKPLDAIFCLIALILTLYRGSAVTFVTLYLPSLLLLNTTQKINIPGAPDMNCTIAVVYGIMGGLVIKGGEQFPFKWGWIDTVMTALAISTTITGMVTEFVYTGISALGEQVLCFLAPYFLARVMFHNAEMRRRALWICVACMFIISFFAVIEMRLSPYFLSRTLKSIGLFTGQNTMVMRRFLLFRTQTTFDHPIDMGNSCMLITALIFVLGMTTSVGNKKPIVALAILAGLCSSFSSLSFTSWVAIAATCATFATLWLLPFSRKLVLVAVLVMFGGFGYMTNHLYKMDLDLRREEDDSLRGQSVQDSMFIRALIVQNSMPFVSRAGLFGWGNTIRHSDLALESVDNSYMLSTMRRGFVYLFLFLMIPVVLAIRSIKAFRRARFRAQVLPLAAGLSIVIGIMAAMYTVWFGFAYSILWIMMVGLTASMMDVLIDGPPAAATAAVAGRRPTYAPSAFAMAQGA